MNKKLCCTLNLNEMENVGRCRSFHDSLAFFSFLPLLSLSMSYDLLEVNGNRPSVNWTGFRLSCLSALPHNIPSPSVSFLTTFRCRSLHKPVVGEEGAPIGKTREKRLKEAKKRQTPSFFLFSPLTSVPLSFRKQLHLFSPSLLPLLSISIQLFPVCVLLNSLLSQMKG